MLKKLIIVVLAGGFLILGGIVWATNAKQSKNLANLVGGDKLFAMSSGDNNPVANNLGVNNCGLTNAKFAEFLGKKYGIKPIEGSAKDKYQALANALSKKGINYFLSAKPNDMTTSSNVADVLYEATGAKGKLGTCGLKVDYMVKNGLLKVPASGGDPCGGTALCNIADVFSGVEKYSPPAINPPPTQPPTPKPEPPSSRI